MKRFALLFVVGLLSVMLAACASQNSTQSSASSEASAAAGASQSDASADSVAEAYVGKWVSDRASLEIAAVDDHFKCTIDWGSSVSENSHWEYDPCLYDGQSLVCEGLGVKTNEVYKANGDVESSEEEFSDGSASFTLGDDGMLTWIDFKVYPDEEGVVFERVAS